MSKDNGWRAIETAPREEVLLYYPPIDHPRRGRTHGAWVTVGYAGLAHRKPTHWQPLPAPPESVA